MPFYYLNDSNQPVGPMDLAAIRKLAEAGIVSADVLVCEAGSEDWIPLSEKNEPPAESGVPKPPRTAPPPLSAVPPRRYTPPPADTAGGSPATGAGGGTTYPDWFPLASMIAGITAIVAMCVPVLSLLLAAPALTLGILALRQKATAQKPFAITGIVTAAVAIVASLGVLLLGLAGGFGGNPEAAAIEKVLKQSAAVSRDAQRRFPDDYPAQARYFAIELQKIDTRSCPPEFRVAFQDNIDAWETAIPYLAANTPLTMFLEGFYGGLTNDFSGVGFSDYQARLAIQNIKDTYQQLKRIAAAYGARIPQL